MDTNETGREPTKPTDAELLRDWANKGRLRLDRAEDHSTFDQYHLACIADADAHRAAMARGREYLSGQRPMPGSEVSRAEVLRMSTDTLLKAEAERMPDTPAPDEVAQPAQFPIGWNEMPPEDVLRAEAKVSLWMREHRITDWALGHSASREMLNRLTARVAELERMLLAVYYRKDEGLTDEDFAAVIALITTAPGKEPTSE